MNSITLTADEKALLDRVDRAARHGEAFTEVQADGLRAIVDRFDLDTTELHVPDAGSRGSNTGGLRG